MDPCTIASQQFPVAANTPMTVDIAVANANNRNTPRISVGLFSSLLLLLVATAIVRSAIATRLDGFTIDEAYHIAAGVSYVRLGDFRINPEHPPLGPGAALGTILFLAIDPTVAAHLPVVMTDLPVSLLCASAVLLAIPVFRSWRWTDLGEAVGGNHRRSHRFSSQRAPALLRQALSGRFSPKSPIGRQQNGCCGNPWRSTLPRSSSTSNLETSS